MFAQEVVLQFCFQDGDFVTGIKLFFPLYGRLMPMALITDEIMLAVYIPHAPAPGHELRSTFFLCSSLIDPVESKYYVITDILSVAMHKN